MGYSVRNIPNTDQLRRVFSGLKRALNYRPRGRGVPPGKQWKDVQYGTALREAPKFTAYYGKAPYVYMEFVSFEDNNLRVKLL